MCGIAGIVAAEIGRAELTPRLAAMQRALDHRGPDDRGMYLSPMGDAGLVHTRLAILDLTSAGHQPMTSPDGRFHIVFNGEIYNFQDLKRSLEAEGEVFQSHSDTEVALRMYARRGAEGVREFEGMFALAIWDDLEKSCFLARDPFGIKPLYVWRQGTTLLFASELRALLASGLPSRELCAESLSEFFLFGSVQEPHTLVSGVQTLPAGHHLQWQRGVSRTTAYWNLHFPRGSVPDGKIQATARAALEESIRRHFVSDVPVGIFLSGGVDSTAVLALARSIGARDLRTFTIAVEHNRFDEGSLAARTARHFGTEHVEWRLTAAEGRQLLAQFLEKVDQPSIDGFNTFCVAKLAKDHGVKVVLSGLGGDELFGGYPSFSAVPKLVRLGELLSRGGPLLPRLAAGLTAQRLPLRWRRAGAFLSGTPTFSAAYWAMRGIFSPDECPKLAQGYGQQLAPEQVEKAIQFRAPVLSTPEDTVSYLELTRYMRNQLLRDADVMSMAWGIELRVPFVDRKLFDALAVVSSTVRLAAGKRWLLAAVPEIPEWIQNQPKRGFLFPIEQWVRDEWHDVFRELDAHSPVRLRSWYRRWCLLALEASLDRCGVAGPRIGSVA